MNDDGFLDGVFDFVDGLMKYNYVPSKEKPAAIEKDEPFSVPMDKINSRPWKGIVWHHSFSADTPKSNWEAIVKYQTSHRIDYNIVTPEEFLRRKKANDGTKFQRPWRDVGYNGGVEYLKGKPVYKSGRPLNMIGAHAGIRGNNKFNRDYIGLCCLGNFDVDAPPEDKWKFCLEVTRTFMKEFDIPAHKVIGHREVYDKMGIPQQKSCPGTAWDMDKFRMEL